MIKTFESFFWQTDGKKLFESLFNCMSKYWIIHKSNNRIYIDQNKFSEIDFCDDDVTIIKNKDILKIKFNVNVQNPRSRSNIEIFREFLKSKLMEKNLITSQQFSKFNREQSFDFNIINIDKVINIINNITIEEYQIMMDMNKYNL